VTTAQGASPSNHAVGGSAGPLVTMPNEKVAYLAHVQARSGGAHLAEHVLTLQAGTPPARCGFMVDGLPVAWPRSELFEVTAASWAPTTDGALHDGGVDIIAWAALTAPAVKSGMLLAGRPTRHARARGHMRRSVAPADRDVLLGYGQTTKTDAQEWVGVVQATWVHWAFNT
jgi:hypothetical protein